MSEGGKFSAMVFQTKNLYDVNNNLIEIFSHISCLINLNISAAMNVNMILNHCLNRNRKFASNKERQWSFHPDIYVVNILCREGDYAPNSALCVFTPHCSIGLIVKYVIQLNLLISTTVKKINYINVNLLYNLKIQLCSFKSSPWPKGLILFYIYLSPENITDK